MSPSSHVRMLLFTYTWLFRTSNSCVRRTQSAISGTRGLLLRRSTGKVSPLIPEGRIMREVLQGSVGNGFMDLYNLLHKRNPILKDNPIAHIILRQKVTAASTTITAHLESVCCYDDDDEDNILQCPISAWHRLQKDLSSLHASFVLPFEIEQHKSSYKKLDIITGSSRRYCSVPAKDDVFK